MSALGYYVPGDQEQIDIQFLPQPGRLHLGFPALRPSFGGHLRQGRAGRFAAQRLERYMAQRGIGWKGRPSTATCCRRSKRRLEEEPRRGRGWLAVGDAAGLVDPITGEGLYYAMRSADLAAKALLSELGGWPKSCKPIAHAAPRFRRGPGIWLAPRQACLPGQFLFGAVPARMVAPAGGIDL